MMENFDISGITFENEKAMEYFLPVARMYKKCRGKEMFLQEKIAKAMYVFATTGELLVEDGMTYLPMCTTEELEKIWRERGEVILQK